MKIIYFARTDTLYIELRDARIAETRELDEDVLLDVDRDGAHARSQSRSRRTSSSHS